MERPHFQWTVRALGDIGSCRSTSCAEVIKDGNSLVCRFRSIPRSVVHSCFLWKQLRPRLRDRSQKPTLHRAKRGRHRVAHPPAWRISQPQVQRYCLAEAEASPRVKNIHPPTQKRSGKFRKATPLHQPPDPFKTPLGRRPRETHRTPPAPRSPSMGAKSSSPESPSGSAGACARSGARPSSRRGVTGAGLVSLVEHGSRFVGVV